MKQPIFLTITLEKIVGGGQALGQLADGRKAFVWGGLPQETVVVRLTKQKSRFVEGVVTEVITPSPVRTAAQDPDSYLSTSPWQIMTPQAEQHYKAALIAEAYSLHSITLPGPIELYQDDTLYGYRNKIEFSWYSDTVVPQAVPQKEPEASLGPASSSDGIHAVEMGEANRQELPHDTLDLAFYTRGSKGKIPVDGTHLARPEINRLAHAIRDTLAASHISARQLKTLLIRCDQSGNCVWQLYVRDRLPEIITADEAAKLPAQGGEIIYSDPRSPASRITERLAHFGDTTLTDTILGVPFRYACEGFFQVNIPVYEQALRDMREWVPCDRTGQHSGRQLEHHQKIIRDPRKVAQIFSEVLLAANRPTLDLYAGVGTIGLTIGGSNVTLVEINTDAVREMQRNIAELDRTDARAVLAPSEQALDHITGKEIVIVDPPRAGLHPDVIATLLQKLPPRIIYLSCNPVTQARDVALLQQNYHIVHHRGYNFFPRTPHIEHLIILDKKP